MGKLSGVNKHKARMLSLAGPELETKLGGVLFEGAGLIKTEAQISITTGATSADGQHVPSLPGQPPNNDTGVLANNIEAERIGPLHARVSSNAPYSAPLEFGTSKMAARPYMEPAAQKLRPAIVEKAVAAVNIVLRKTGNGG